MDYYKIATAVKDKKLFILQVEKEDIDKQSIDNVVHAINNLESNMDICQKVMITIDGYNDVNDELFAIPEVRSWVRKLFNHMPQLFYYLNQELEAHVFIMNCLADDLSSVYVGELKPIEEYTDYKTIPKINTHIIVKNETIKRMINGVLVHGKKMKKNLQAKAVAYSIQRIFDKI